MNNMEVYGTIRTKVDVRPIDAINSMLKIEFGGYDGTKEENGKYYLEDRDDPRYGCLPDKEIDKKKYDAVNALILLSKYF